MTHQFLTSGAFAHVFLFFGVNFFLGVASVGAFAKDFAMVARAPYEVPSPPITNASCLQTYCIPIVR